MVSKGDTLWKLKRLLAEGRKASRNSVKNGHFGLLSGKKVTVRSGHVSFTKKRRQKTERMELFELSKFQIFVNKCFKYL